MSALTFMTEKLSCEHLGARNLLKEKIGITKNFMYLPSSLHRYLPF